MSKEGGNEESPQGGDSKKDPNADLFENRGTKKIIRLVTVMAYMFSVSFVAIVLSAYYLFLWEPPNPKLLRRPVHLSSEPEVQFLIADAPDLQNDVSMNNFLSGVSSGENGSNSSHKSLFGRVVDDNRLDGHYGGKKHRRTLNESLVLLRNSLVELMRNRANRSKVDGEFTGKEKQLNSKEDEEKTEIGRSKNEKNDTGFSKIMFGDNATVLTPNSSTIPGDAVNNDRFTSTWNSSLSKNTLRSPENVARGQSKRNVSASLGKEGSSGSLSKIEELTNSNEGFVNIRGNTMINKLNVVASMKGEDSGVQENREEQFATVKNGGSLKHLRRPIGSSAKLTSTATNLKETQIEKMTIKSTTVGQESTDSPETVTTRRPKDLLTILTEINGTSGVSPFPTVADLSTDSNTESKETSTEKQSKVT